MSSTGMKLRATTRRRSSNPARKYLENKRPIRRSFWMGRGSCRTGFSLFSFDLGSLYESRQAEARPTYVANRSRANIGNRRLRERGVSRGGAAIFSGALGAGESSCVAWFVRTGKPNKLSGAICPDAERAGMRPSDASRLRATRSATPNFASREET